MNKYEELLEKREQLQKDIAGLKAEIKELDDASEYMEKNNLVR